MPLLSHEARKALRGAREGLLGFPAKGGHSWPSQRLAEGLRPDPLQGDHSALRMFFSELDAGRSAGGKRRVCVCRRDGPGSWTGNVEMRQIICAPQTFRRAGAPGLFWKLMATRAICFVRRCLPAVSQVFSSTVPVCPWMRRGSIAASTHRCSVARIRRIFTGCCWAANGHRPLAACVRQTRQRFGARGRQISWTLPR